MREIIRIVLGCIVACAVGVPAFAQYPSRTISLIVPFPAGGPTDVVARLVADSMSRTLGQPIIVENTGGAGGTLGMTRAAQAPADGYTIAIGNTGTQSAAPALYPDLKYDPIKSFTQIGIVSFTPEAIVAKRSMQAATLTQFIEYLKGSSTKLIYGHAGVGSISYVSGLLFNSRFDLHPTLVPYRGTGPALEDLVGGRIDYMIDQSLNVIPQIKAGTIRAYAVAARRRLETLPDVPTTVESGVDFTFRAWNAMVAPKDIPPQVVARLAAALDIALEEPSVRARFVELGSTVPDPADRGPAGLERLVASEIEQIGPVIKAAAGMTK